MAVSQYVSPGRSLCQLWDEMTREDTGALSGQYAGDADIHRLRVASKQCRAHLRLIRNALDSAFLEREDRALRDAAKRLATLRDSHVTVKTLVALPKASSSPKLWKAIRQALEALDSPQKNVDHSALENHPMLDFHAESAVPEVAASMRAHVHELIDALDAETGLDTFNQGLRQTYKRGRRHLANWRKTDASPCAHRFRKQVKYLAFQTAFLTPYSPKFMEERTPKLQKLERTLGKFNDITVVESRLQALMLTGKLSPKNRTLILEALHSREDKLRKQALTLSKKLFNPSPGKFADLLPHE